MRGFATEIATSEEHALGRGITRFQAVSSYVSCSIVLQVLPELYLPETGNIL